MNRTMTKYDYDAIVIGARCAGAATARLLAQAGWRVLIVDRATEIGDTLSTHALMWPAVLMLQKWGLFDRAIQTSQVINTVHFHYADQRLSLPAKPRGTVPGLIAPRRAVLDRILLDAALEAGCELRLGTRFVDVEKDGDGRVIGVCVETANGACSQVTASVTIGADGRLSRVAAAVGARIAVRSEARTATLFAYVDGLRNDGYRWFYDVGRTAGIIPSTGRGSCVFIGCPPGDAARHLGGDALGALTRMIGGWSPEVANAISCAGMSSRPYRFLGAAGFMRQCSGPGWALVGDAGYFKDPCTSHGISDAFIDAERLTRALIATPDNAASYQETRNDKSRAFFDLTQRIASFDWTLDELKVHHLATSQEMKAEQAGLLSDVDLIAA